MPPGHHLSTQRCHGWLALLAPHNLTSLVRCTCVPPCRRYPVIPAAIQSSPPFPQHIYFDAGHPALCRALHNAYLTAPFLLHGWSWIQGKLQYTYMYISHCCYSALSIASLFFTKSRFEVRPQCRVKPHLCQDFQDISLTVLPKFTDLSEISGRTLNTTNT